MYWSDISHAEYNPRDFDLIFFDARCIEKDFELDLENRLNAQTGDRWNIKNQARFPKQSKAKYSSLLEALAYAPSTVSSIGAALRNNNQELYSFSIFGFSDLLSMKLRANPNREDLKDVAFATFVAQKGWQSRWPQSELILAS